GDDSLATAPRHAMIVDRRTFAESLLRHHEEICLALDDDHADDLIVGTELDAFHARGVAPHLTNVLLVEANGQTVTRGEDDVVRARRHLDVDHLVALLDLDRL